MPGAIPSFDGVCVGSVVIIVLQKCKQTSRRKNYRSKLGASKLGASTCLLVRVVHVLLQCDYNV